MMEEMIFVNFKTYKQGTGEKAVELAKICGEVENETSVKIFPVVQVVDIYRVFKEAGGEIWAQYADEVEYGANTGGILVEGILAAGGMGVILNHSERKLTVEIVGKTIDRCREVGLKTLVCSENLEEAKQLVEFKPDFLAFEPVELIGSKTISVATGKGEIIKDFVENFSEMKVLVGAGIHEQKDVRISKQLGAVGILVASDVVLAEDSKKQLFDLAKGFGNGEI